MWLNLNIYTFKQKRISVDLNAFYLRRCMWYCSGQVIALIKNSSLIEKDLLLNVLKLSFLSDSSLSFYGRGQKQGGN